MTLESRELFGGPANIAQTPRMSAERLSVLKMAAGSDELPVGTPLARNSATGFWVPWTQPSDAASFTITADGTPASGGTFALLIDGLDIALAYNVTAAQLESQCNEVLANAGRPYTMSAAATAGANLGASSAVVTITFSENAGAPDVEIDTGDLTGNPHVLAEVDPGTALNETNLIRAFVYDAPHQLSATGETLAVAMILGEVYAADVNTAAIRAVLGGSPSSGELAAALAAVDVARFVVRGAAQA